MNFTVEAIGRVEGGRIEPVDDAWDAVEATIVLAPEQVGPDALKGLDAIDGTPVLDIKPVLHGFLPRGEVREPARAREIMAGYR